jgi:hypothetical protein
VLSVLFLLVIVLSVLFLLAIVLSVLFLLAIGDDFNLTSKNPWFRSFLVISNPLSRKFYKNHKLWNIGSTERYIFHMQARLECCYI